MTAPASKLRVGLVGLGGIARGQHLPGYLLCDNIELTAFCDVDTTTLQAMGEQYGVTRLTTDYNELVSYPDLDIVDICTYPNTHHPIAMAAIAQGKHVFCEKPLALTYPLAREMAEAARAAGLKTGVGFTHRLTPASLLAHHLIDSGALGEIYQVMAVYSMGSAGFAGSPLTPRRTRAVTGGGPLFELGPHMVDMVRWWTGKAFTAVCAQTRTFIKKRRWHESGAWVDVDVDDAATFLADMEGETMAVFSHSSAITGRNFDQRVEVYGSQGALLYDQGQPYELRACIGETMVDLCAGYGIYDPQYGQYRTETVYPVIPVPRRFRDVVPGTRQGQPVRSWIPTFVDVVRNQETAITSLLPTFDAGMQAQEVLDAVLRSAAERRWVDLPLA